MRITEENKVKMRYSDIPAIYMGQVEVPYKPQYVHGEFVWTCHCGRKISSNSYLGWQYFEMAVKEHTEECKVEGGKK